MNCERCGKKTATHFFKQTVNGKTTTYNLCDDCAKEMGVQKIFHDPFSVGNLFSDFLFPTAKTIGQPATARCAHCGKTLDEIMADGMVGCADCYKTFEAALAPSIEKLHGNATHTGKVPRSAGEGLRRKKQLEELKAQMNDAIRAEDFESAAKLRDRIRAFENENKGEEGHHA